MFNIETYNKAQSVSEAVTLLAENPRARVLAGGTDVLIRLREGDDRYSQLIDIHDLAELQQIQQLAGGEICIGAGVTFSQLMDNRLIQERLPLVAQAAGTVGGPQVRNVATIGGNLCNGAISADSAAALYVLDAVLEIEGVSGVRDLPIGEFYLGPGQVALEHSDVLRAIRIPAASYRDYGTHYYKYAMRNAMDIATIGCAAACKVKAGCFDTLKIAFTVAAPKPMRARSAEQFAVGQAVTPALINELAGLVLQDLNPRDSWRASKEFRLHIIKTLARRVIMAAAGVAEA